MTNSSIPSLNTVSINNKKIDCVVDAMVESAQGAEQAGRRDCEQLEKTSQLMLFLSLLIGESNAQDDTNGI